MRFKGFLNLKFKITGCDLQATTHELFRPGLK